MEINDARSIEMKSEHARQKEDYLITYIAANCIISNTNIVSMVKPFVVPEIAHFLSPEFKNDLPLLLERDSSVETIRSHLLECIQEMPRFRNSLDAADDRYDFLDSLAKSTSQNKRLLAQILRAVFTKNLHHSDMHGEIREQLIKQVVVNRIKAINIIQETAGNINELYLCNIIRLAILKDLNTNECEAFFWDLSRSAAELERGSIAMATVVTHPGSLDVPDTPLGEITDLAMASDTKKALGTAKDLAKKMAELDPRALEIIGWCAMTARSVFEEEYYEQHNCHYNMRDNYSSDVLNDMLATPAYWEKLSEQIAGMNELTVTKKHTERFYALYRFCEICMRNNIFNGNRTPLSRGTAIYKVALDFLEYTIGLDKITFERDLLHAYRLLLAQR